MEAVMPLREWATRLGLMTDEEYEEMHILIGELFIDEERYDEDLDGVVRFRARMIPTPQTREKHRRYNVLVARLESTVNRTFYVRAETGLQAEEAEWQFKVDISFPETAKGPRYDPARVLLPGTLISVEGLNDNVYRLFDLLCPGVLTEEQRHELYHLGE